MRRLTDRERPYPRHTGDRVDLSRVISTHSSAIWWMALSSVQSCTITLQLRQLNDTWSASAVLTLLCNLTTYNVLQQFKWEIDRRDSSTSATTTNLGLSELSHHTGQSVSQSLEWRVMRPFSCNVGLPSPSPPKHNCGICTNWKLDEINIDICILHRELGERKPCLSAERCVPTASEE